ncbi:MAG: hypothetical protein ACYDA1_07450 [Vulcanimicrobiaceae bacterium]
MRDFFDHAQSCYQAAARQPEVRHPAHETFLRENMRALDLVAAYPNYQSLYLDGLPLDAFETIGVAERNAERSALFEARINVNSETTNDMYAAAPELRTAGKSQLRP